MYFNFFQRGKYRSYIKLRKKQLLTIILYVNWEGRRSWGKLMTYILQYVLFSSGETTKPQNVLGNTLRTHLKMNESFCPLFILLKNSVALSIVPKLFSSYSFAFIEYINLHAFWRIQNRDSWKNLCKCFLHTSFLIAHATFRLNLSHGPIMKVLLQPSSP